MSQHPYTTEQLLKNLKELILKKEASAPLPLIDQANGDCHYPDLLIACFEPIPTENSFLHKNSTKNFFDSIPSTLTLEHAHFGYLHYLAKKHRMHISEINGSLKTFTEENLEKWCHDYYHALKNILTITEKLYLIKLLPKNGRLNDAIEYLNSNVPDALDFLYSNSNNNSMKFESEQNKMTNLLEILSLCFKFNDQEFLQHLFALFKMKTSRQNTIYYNSLLCIVYLYNHAPNTTLKTAYKDFITQTYYFNQNADFCDREKLTSAWKEIETRYNRGQLVENNSGKQLFAGLMVFFIPPASTLLFLALAVPAPGLIIALAVVIALAIACGVFNCYFNYQTRDYDYIEHKKLKQAISTLEGFMINDVNKSETPTQDLEPKTSNQA